MSSFKQFLLPTLLAALTSAGVMAAQVKTAPPVNSQLDAGLFYELLVGELSAQANDNGTAFGLILNAARKSNSPVLYERAVNLALRERSGDSALEAAQSWAKAFPASLEANRYVFQILIGLNRIAEVQEPLRRTLAAMPTAERLTTISQLPRYFLRSTEKKLVVKVVEQVLTTAVTQHTTSPAAWSTIGVLRLQAGDTTGALEAAQRGAAANPKAQEPVVLAIALINPQAPAAEALVRKYLADKPVPELRMAYTRHLLATQRYAEAAAQMRVLTQESPEYPEAWLVRGSLELESKKIAPAEASLKNYVKLTTQTSNASKTSSQERGLVQAYWLLAQISELNLQLDEALTYLDRIESEQDAMRVQTRKAIILARQGKMDDARTVIRNTPELHADDARTKINTEMALLREYKQYQDAYDVLTQAVANHPQDTDFLYEQAMMAERIGKVDEMEATLRKIITIKPDHYHAYNALGYSLAERGIRLPEAKQLITKALSLLPNDPDLQDSLAWVEFRAGNAAEALSLLRSAFKARPNAEIAAHLGEVLWSMGQRDEANSVWQEGTKLNPKNDVLVETTKRLRNTP